MDLHRSKRGSSRSNSTPTAQPLAAAASVCIPRLRASRRPGGGSDVEVKIEDDYNSDYDDDYPVSSSDLSSTSNRRHSSSPLKRKKSLNLGACAEDGEHVEKRTRREMTEKLVDLMECPVCLDFPRSAPIFSCRNGHLICAKCQPKLECCPICRSPDVGCRNGFAEKFVRILFINLVSPRLSYIFYVKQLFDS